ncbi:hypothetical protein ABL78_0501 [Leptomonas seymouri]|uniref:Uncharacterized protein n=1 Tax=Leptomonas seymouri TaxID=5684 RepID=A0A0N1PFA3_LEPSE|nr:hypothetical protein ABL78_0501 [Leptomonas seymouri]|eukprot:KPI90425.1 hypothetical protein ABL78_0501 [Leptomonas seymouri]
MPAKTVAEARRCIPSSVLENQLLQAPHKPAALYQVVDWIWSSLVYAATPDNTAENINFASTTPPAFTGMLWEVQTPQQPPHSTFAASSLLYNMTSGVATSVHDEPVMLHFKHAVAGQTAGNGEAIFSDAESEGFQSTTNTFDTTLTVAAAAGLSAITTTTTSVATAPTSVVGSPRSVNSLHTPVAELSPLVLRLLLWWASRPQLPSMHGGASGADGCGAHDSWGPTKGFTGDCTGGDEYVPRQQRRQQEAGEAHQLRLRIAEIFWLLCRRGFGVIVSDALVYGRCHDSSEAATGRCSFVFGSCPDASWRSGTSISAAAPVANMRSSAGGADGGAAELLPGAPRPSGDMLDAAAGTCGVPSRYSLERLLCALVRLQTLQTGTVVSDADVASAGQLLRALLTCPRLHKRIIRLFDSDRPSTKVEKSALESTPSTVLLRSPSIARHLGASEQPLHTQAGAGKLDAAAASSLRLQSFLPALMHPSPIISSEAWRTFGLLLFPSANLTAATRHLLQRTPECPVQHLLASALALPGDEQTSPQDSSVPPPLLQSSHPVARNNALRILHVLCVSKSVSPVCQQLFTQCPALLWRVLKLAAELCKGSPLADMALVRRVLADYVISAVRPSTASRVTTLLTPVQLLLRSNWEALTRLLSSTYAQWGMRDGAALFLEDNGGDSVDAPRDAVDDEADLQRAMQMLQT